MYTPWTSRTVGIEMEINECNVRRESLTMDDVTREIQREMRTVNATRTVRNCGGWASSTSGRSWDIKTDSSAGFEIASPALRLDAEGDSAELKAACAGLAALQPQIDRSCGLHVNVDCSDFSWQDVQKLVALWARYEPFFFEMVPAHRKGDNGNVYCVGLRKESWTGATTEHWRTVQEALSARTQDQFNEFSGQSFTGRGRTFTKYSSLNVSKWWHGGLVEFRLHSGTINYTKIRNFTKLLLAVVNRVKMVEMAPISTTVNVSDAVDASRVDGRIHTRFMAKLLGLSVTRGVDEVPASNAALLAWMDERRAKFATVQRRARVAPGARRTARGEAGGSEASEGDSQQRNYTFLSGGYNRSGQYRAAR